MKQAILIIAHCNFSHLQEMINKFDLNFQIYIHLDKKQHITQKECDTILKIPVVKGFYRQYKINWGGFNMLRAILYLFRKAIQDEDNQYFHLLSGQDYPIKHISDFEKFIKDNQGKEFLEYHTLPHSKWENNTFRRYQYFYLFDIFDFRTAKGSRRIVQLLNWQTKMRLKRPIPQQFDTLYGGACWFSLSRDCIKYVLDYTQKKPSFYRKLKYTFVPEETYFHTIILNSPFKGKVINKSLRYVDWKARNGNCPANLDHNDLYYLIISDDFFARKFDPSVSSYLQYLIDKYLFNHSYQSKKIAFDKGLSDAFSKSFHYMQAKYIIQLGCGIGLYVRYLRDQGYIVSGYDNSSNKIDFSQHIVKKSFCEELDMQETILIDDPYDVVICLNVKAYISEIFLENIMTLSKKYIILANCEDHEESIISKLSTKNFVENNLLQLYFKENAFIESHRKTIKVFQKR